MDVLHQHSSNRCMWRPQSIQFLAWSNVLPFSTRFFRFLSTLPISQPTFHPSPLKPSGRNHPLILKQFLIPGSPFTPMVINTVLVLCGSFFMICHRTISDLFFRGTKRIFFLFIEPFDPHISAFLD